MLPGYLPTMRKAVLYQQLGCCRDASAAACIGISCMLMHRKAAQALQSWDCAVH